MELLNNDCHSEQNDSGVEESQRSLDKLEMTTSSNEIHITINKPRDKVFEFVLEPKNTSNWIDFIKSETIDTEQISVGTKYTNDFGKLTVTDYERNIYFELTDDAEKYQCSYSFKKIDDNTTEIIYFECMLDGSKLDEPFDVKHFEKLKKIIER